MRILLEISDSDIPKKQEIITVPIHFIDGTICEAGGFGFNVLPKGHGALKDIDKIGLTNFECFLCNGDYKEALKMLINKIENAPTIIEADKEVEDEKTT